MCKKLNCSNAGVGGEGNNGPLTNYQISQVGPFDDYTFISLKLVLFIIYVHFSQVGPFHYMFIL
jgi:hypothetical protein